MTQPAENPMTSVKESMKELNAENAKAQADAAPPQFKFKTQVMFLDKRPISSIHEMGTDKPWEFIVGKDGITEIELYGENGPACMLPWFAVWKGETLIFRTAAQNFSVVYQHKNEGEKS